MRGKHCIVSHIVKIRRIIPAHAGQTRGRACGRAAHTDHPRACGANVEASMHARVHWADHPRACGANTLRDVCRVADIGSSPRMRGKRLIPLAKRTPTILEKFDLHSRSHFANVIMVPNFLTSARNPQFNIAATTIYQNDDIAMHCSNLFYEMRPEISRWIRLDHEAS